MIEPQLKPQLKKTRSKFQQDPKLFFKNILGVEELEVYQRHVINKVAENDRVCIAACHDVGKSFLMARIAMWFLNCFPNSKVITTAPTFNQVEKILWSEIRAAHGKAKFPLGGRLNQTDWTFNPEWFALGFSPRNEATGGEGQGTQSSFQGFHASYLLVIFDEATGIPPNIWTMAEGLLTSAHVKFIAIGNPTSSASEFYRCFKDPLWTKVYLTCFDSPNLKANNINSKKDLEREIEKVSNMKDDEANQYYSSYKVVKPYLLTAKWVVSNAKKWGIDHPLTVSKILGTFPKAGEKTMFPLDHVEQAQLRVVYPEKTDRKIIGIDVARMGNDSTEMTVMHGKKQLARRAFYKTKTLELSGEAIALSREFFGDFPDIFVVDETGLGGGLVDTLEGEVIDQKKNCEIRGIQFGSTDMEDEDKEKYADMKARMFGLLEQDLKDEDGISLINDSVYLDELPTIQKNYTKKGQLKVESKDEYKKRTGRGSPDRADSLALANFGRYDEMNAGTFTKAIKQTEEQARPKAGSLRSSKNW
jgi:phage terminase large subunit